MLGINSSKFYTLRWSSKNPFLKTDPMCASKQARNMCQHCRILVGNMKKILFANTITPLKFKFSSRKTKEPCLSILECACPFFFKVLSCPSSDQGFKLKSTKRPYLKRKMLFKLHSRKMYRPKHLIKFGHIWTIFVYYLQIWGNLKKLMRHLLWAVCGPPLSELKSVISNQGAVS